MSRSSPFKQATAQHKYQFDFLLAKLELILANPLAKVSVILTVGPQKIESTQRPKASKETFLKETLSILVNLYEEPKKQAYQEKTATLEVFLNNSKVSNLIGVLKLDLANYVNSTGEKLESMVLQKSPEYQGKILFGVNASRIEELQEEEIRSNAQNSKNFNNLEPNDSVSQRDMSDAGGVKNGQKRSVTPNLRPIKTPGTDKLMHVVDRMLMKSVEIKPVENMNRLSSNLITKKNKNTSLLEPVLNKTNNVIEEFTNDEKSKLEKFIFAFKPERKTENRLPENENLRDYNDMKINFLNLEKENYRLKQENIDLKGELEKEKTIINDLLKGDEDKLEILHKNDLSLAEKRLEELKKENDRLLEEKYLLENSVLSQKKANEEINAKLTIQIDENSMLRKQTANLNEFLNKKEKQMKTLIEEINRGKQEGAAESFVDKTDRLKIIEEELKKQDVDMGNLKKNLQEKIALLQETKGNLEKSNNEANSQKKEIQQFKEQVANLEKISEINNERLKEMEDLRGNYLRSKQNLADIINLVFFSGTNELIEEVDKILTVDIN